MAANIDEQFVEFIVKSLVGNPDAVTLERRIDEKGVLLELTVDPEDLGRVIGKRGATAQSLRTLLRALGTKHEARYNLKIVDSDAPGMSPSTSTSAAPQDDTAGSQDDSALTASSVTKPQDDDLDEDDTSRSAKDVRESDTIARTRRELADLDDLDV